MQETRIINAVNKTLEILILKHCENVHPVIMTCDIEDTSIAHAYILSTLIIFIFFPSVLFLKMISVCFYEFGLFGT